MPAKSPYPLLDIPNVDLWTLLFENKKRPFPDDQVIFQDADTLRSYTYAEVKSTALEFGMGLKAAWDWQKGDVLAIISPNSIDMPPVIWGTHWAGGIVSPANPAYTVDELAFQLKGVKAKALVTQLALLPTATAAAKRAGIPEDRIILLGDARDPSAKFKHFTSVRNISKATRYRKTRIDPAKDLAFLSFSSGTTGMPKGVMLSHRNIVSNIMQFTAGEAGNLSWEGDKVLAFLPFFHIYGLTCLIHKSMYTGVHMVVMPKFDIEKWCAHIQNFRITFSYVVPPVVVLLAKHPAIDKYNLSSLRLLNCGAAPLSRELVEAMTARIKTGVKQGYGLSETSPTTHTQAWADWDKYIGSCLSPDGWFRTGDVGHQDEHGNLYITDRVKELIKYKGFQVAPAELEGVLVENEAISDVAVIGVESEEHGSEVPRAYVVLKVKAAGNEAVAEAEKIMKWLAGKVAPHKRLRGGVKFIDEIPKSASGKILRRVLKEQAKKEDADGRVKAKL
ncbi:hypothetical protein EMPG_13948 [Blastomyces silverae]|uniref:Phenylacetyl-CoA ligase n=1 Tax=Blastomyces silverae TaxID=2060906 RepID=A0A0H1BGM1_9EURO|nr:hypothetical protein EMPG_13948 [Blastomyces silverae]